MHSDCEAPPHLPAWAGFPPALRLRNLGPLPVPHFRKHMVPLGFVTQQLQSSDTKRVLRRGPRTDYGLPWLFCQAFKSYCRCLLRLALGFSSLLSYRCSSRAHICLVRLVGM